MGALESCKRLGEQLVSDPVKHADNCGELLDMIDSSVLSEVGLD